MDLEIEIELQSVHGEVKVLFLKNVEKLSSYIDRHKHIQSTNIRVSRFDLVLYKNPRENTFLIPSQYLNIVHIEKEENDIQILFDIMPFTEFTLHNYYNSDRIIRRTEIAYLDTAFEISYLHFKLRIITPVQQTAKKRYSWFNK